MNGKELTLVDDKINILLGCLWFLECELGQGQFHPSVGQGQLTGTGCPAIHTDFRPYSASACVKRDSLRLPCLIVVKSPVNVVLELIAKCNHPKKVNEAF